MKKIIALIMVAAVLLALPICVQAAGASLSGPDVIRAGDTITLTFYANGNITGIQGSVSYDSSLLTLKSYTARLGGGWTGSFNGNNFLFYEDNLKELGGSTAVFTATFQVNSNVAPGTEVSVSVYANLSNAEADQYSGTSTWKRTVSEPLSGNANLASLVVSNANITPGFNTNTTEYTASVPFETSKLQVSATAEHPGAKVTIGSTALVENATTDVQVIVTAENGATKVYHIRVARPRDPNYVESGVNTLDSLAVENFFISPAFTPERQAYAVYLPYETECLDISAKLTDKRAELSIPELSFIPVGESTYDFVVTAENGDTRIYTLTVYRAEPFLPDVEPEETEPTEPATEPAEETTEPTTEPAVDPTTEATEPVVVEKEAFSFPVEGIVVFLVCLVISFVGGVFVPRTSRKRKKK